MKKYIILLFLAVFLSACAGMKQTPLQRDLSLAEQSAAVEVDTDANDKIDQAFGGLNTDISAIDGLLKNDSATETISAATAGTDYVESESDPIVGAISGIVKADGAGNISAATEGTDYLADITGESVGDLANVDESGVADGNVLKYNGTSSVWEVATDDTGSGGSAIVLDLADDGVNESTDLSEIATSGDTNSIFTEPTADKLLIDLSNAWPMGLDNLSDVTGTGNANYLLQDDGDGTYSFTNSLSVSSFIVPNGTSAAPTTDGSFYWKTDTDALTIGDSSTAQPIVLKDVDQGIWQSVAISPAAMIADGTNATDPASEQVNSGPNMWFSTVSDAAGTLEFQIPMPENWDGGNLYVELIAGSLEATPSGTVEFEVSTQSVSDDEIINNTYVTGDNIQFASTIDTQYDAVVAESDVIAAAGAGGDLLLIKLTRDNDDGTNDTSTQDVEVWGARVYYQIDDMDERD